MHISRMTRLIENCPICGNKEQTSIAQHPELSFVKCPCGIIYKSVDNLMTPDQKEYDSSYFASENKASKSSYEKRRWRRIQKSRRQIRDALEHIPPGPVLDIGCSLGYTLQAAKQLGLDATGMDVSDFAVTKCKEQGFEACVGTINEPLPFADDSFQLVVMKHVLEHTPEPQKILSEIKRILKPGGGVFIAVPHAEYYKAIRSPQTYHFFLPERAGKEHDIYYKPETLSKLLEREGYLVHRVYPHLLHRRAPMKNVFLELMALPFYALYNFAVRRFKLHKEFTVVASVS